MKEAASIDTSKYSKKADLASLKLNAEKLDIDKFQTTPIDLSKGSNVVKNYFVKKTIYHELVKKFNAIQTNDTSDLVEKAEYNAKILEIEKKFLKMINILLLKILINYQVQYLMKD